MKRIVIAGGGAAGFFAAITCAETCAEMGQPAEVMVLEHGAAFLTKVRLSGGGRCNVTHASSDARDLAAHYPRGGRALIGPFQRFGPPETTAWFQARGVALKTEGDGRMFPATDSSQTIVDALLRAASAAGVILRAHCGVEGAVRREGGGFDLTLSGGRALFCDRLLLATGGCRLGGGEALARSLGHTVEPPVSSLFTFRVETPWLRALAGVSANPVEVSVPGTKLRERGPLLATHWGVSGPAILRLSAWGARLLHERDYQFPLCVHWLPGSSREALTAAFLAKGASQPAGFVWKSPLPPLPLRLWEALLAAARVPPETRWGALSREARERLATQLTRTEFQVTGKSANKAEFVTCGGVRLAEVDFKTQQSRIAPGLFFAGELLDIDGLTGGFNFQAAWTTGWSAGRAMAQLP
ncbi:MAG: NAD(P)/FAD-dependent oxidoreductase [Chthoniobacteraceae bacterium]|nr:NAD(P)/FAD-dependent oxidoreductase [Chthoniobacteraceae bacterium]